MNAGIDITALVREQFDAEDQCIGFLEKTRWPDGVCCPNCGNLKISRFHTAGKTGKVRHLYQCLEKTCRHQFSATTGTMFHDSHLPLTKWFTAIALVSESKGEISANQLRNSLGIQYRTAQHVLDRIRKALKEGTVELAAERGAALQASPILALGAEPSVHLAMESVSETTIISNKIAKQNETPSTIDNALSIADSLTQMTIRPPLFFVNCIARLFS